MRKRMICVLIALAMMVSGCSSGSSGRNETSSKVMSETTAKAEKSSSSSSTSTASSSKESTGSSSSSSTSSSSSFTNKYGSSTTKCAKAGCDNPIVSSGDSAYCSTHSNRCLECGKYIDGDAMYCIDCLTKAASSSSSSSSGSSSSSYGGNSSSDSYNNSDGYAYDPSDKYYSANDKDGDGKINDQEFQNAFGDLLDDLAAEGY